MLMPLTESPILLTMRRARWTEMMREWRSRSGRPGLLVSSFASVGARNMKFYFAAIHGREENPGPKIGPRRIDKC